MGTLPAAGLREDAGLGVETTEDRAGLLGASLAAGGLLTGVEAAACDFDFDAFGAGLSFLETGVCLAFTFLVTFPFFSFFAGFCHFEFFVLTLRCFTVIIVTL